MKILKYILLWRNVDQQEIYPDFYLGWLGISDMPRCRPVKFHKGALPKASDLLVFFYLCSRQLCSKNATKHTCQNVNKSFASEAGCMGQRAWGPTVDSYGPPHESSHAYMWLRFSVIIPWFFSDSGWIALCSGLQGWSLQSKCNQHLPDGAVSVFQFMQSNGFVVLVSLAVTVCKQSTISKATANSKAKFY